MGIPQLNRHALTAFVLGALLLSNDGYADMVATDWSGVDNRNAIGFLDGIQVEATASGANINVSSGAFASSTFVPPIGASAEAIGGVDWDSGDWLNLDLSQSTDSLYVYLENFDLNSAATLTGIGATDIQMISSDGFIDFTQTSASSADLVSLTSGFGGQGDAVFLLSGSVTSVQFNWTGGTQNNGVNYTIAKQSVPVPATTGLLTFVVIVGLGSRRRRRTSVK